MDRTITRPVRFELRLSKAERRELDRLAKAMRCDVADVLRRQLVITIEAAAKVAQQASGGS
jgi:acetolactate synthase small subunit